MFSLGEMKAQVLFPQLVSTGGSFHEQIFSVHEFTIAEVMVATLTSPSGKLITQGLLQPSLRGTVGFSAKQFTHDLEMFPNPVSTALNLRTDYAGELTFRLHTIDGKLMNQGRWSQEKKIDFSGLPFGSYVLHHVHNTEIIETAIIVKN